MFELLYKATTVKCLWQELTFWQASYYECLEFSYEVQQKDFNFEDWIFEFLHDKIILTKEDLKEIDLERLIEMLYEKYFDWFFDKKEETEEIDEENIMPFEAYLVYLCLFIKDWPIEILKKYTPKQIELFWKWVEFLENMKTEEWRKINLKKVKSLANYDKDLEEIRQMRELRKKNWLL